MEKIINLCKQYGFIFPSSEIYGGLANTFDYGPLGVELKNNIKKAWYKKFIQEQKYNLGIDTTILMNPKVWEASGHINNFNDPLIDCKNCKMRYRADELILKQEEIDISGWSNEKMMAYIKEKNIKCPNCGKLDYTDIRKFNMMFKTYQGVIEEESNIVYLRPETAQGIFINFLNIQRALRLKIPFGIGQIGKSFRNEITPGNFIFRTREFEQMELEFFCKPGTELDWFEYWKDYAYQFLLSLNISKERLRLRKHTKEELSHYANATLDIEYKFPFGWGELWGLASRTDYDLKAHSNYAKTTLAYLDPDTNEKYVPYVVEPALGVDRLLLVILCEAYQEERLSEDTTRELLKLHPFLAPYKVAIFPLIKKRHEAKAKEIYETLAKRFMVTYDDTGSIGKRYRRQDIIGTPFAITIDDDTLANDTVTIRDRDTMQQEVIKMVDVIDFILAKINF